MTSDAAWAARLRPICEGLARLLAPHGEVVLHDIETDTIVSIWNSFSRRRAGDPALLSEIPSDPESSNVMGPYEKVSTDGRRLTSVSSVYYDDDGKPVGVLCINLDRSPLDSVIRTLTTLAAPAHGERPPVLFERDWREQIALAVDRWCQEKMVDRRRLVRAQRLELVRALEAADLFATRNAAQHVAVALGVSRATVYSLLNEVRRSESANAADSMASAVDVQD